MKVGSRLNLDRVGAVASAICAVHCLLTGVALGLLSVIGLGFMGSPVTETIFLVTTMVVGIAAVVHGRRKHHSLIPAVIFVAGLGCILTSHYVFDHQGAFGTSFAVLGGLSLVAFHVVNQRLQHGCQCGACAHAD